MIWFFERPGERLQCEIRQSASGSGFELVWTTSDGRIHVEVSDDASELIRRRRALEHWLKLDGWIRPGRVTPVRPPRTQRTRKTDAHFHIACGWSLVAWLERATTSSRLPAGFIFGALLAKIQDLILPDILVVLGERARKHVRAVVAADEVQIVAPPPARWRPRVRPSPATRSVLAAGPRTDRCCTASRTTDRRGGDCRRSGPRAASA